MARGCFDIERLRQFESDEGNPYRQFGQGPIQQDPDAYTEIIYEEEDDDPLPDEGRR